jgi:hypothetical protein
VYCHACACPAAFPSGVDSTDASPTTVSGDAETIWVVADVADPDPALLLAVTATSTIFPTSDDCNVYAELVAPPIFEQLDEDEQSRH